MKSRQSLAALPKTNMDVGVNVSAETGTTTVLPARKLPVQELPVRTLADLAPGQHGTIIGMMDGNGLLTRRLTALGIVRGHRIALDRTAPLGDPRLYSLLGYRLSLRNEAARNILLQIEPQPAASAQKGYS